MGHLDGPADDSPTVRVWNRKGLSGLRRPGDKPGGMLNYIWLGLVLAAMGLAGHAGRLGELTTGAIESAEAAVMKTALPLVGITALWLGILRLAERAGLVASLARLMRPLMRWLFPDVPAHHPALGSMVMNMTANFIGLTNAATPLGLRAMKDLESLNPHPGTATNAMCMFLAINTSSIQLIPMTAIGILAVGGSANPTAIVGTSLLATICSTLVGVSSARLLQRFRFDRAPQAAVGGPTPPAPSATPEAGPAPRPLAWWGRLILVGGVVAALWAVVSGAIHGSGSPAARWINAVSVVAVPLFLGMIPLYAALRGVRVFDEFVEGAKEGFQLWVRIIPYLVAMLVAIGMFRAAGGMDLLARGLGPLLGALGFPAELLPMSVMRPLSGSGTIALFRDLVETAGADSLVARMGGTILGSTETTFYVIAVYFGSVGITRTRHAVPAGLLADLAGIIASVWICRLVFAS